MYLTMAYILVFGDSIAWGAWDKEGGWVARLRHWLDECEPEEHIVYNCGVSGDSSSDLLDRFLPECEARLREAEEYKEKQIIIIAIGGNDASWSQSKNTMQIPFEKFEQNIQKLNALASKFTKKVIFIGLTPVDESKTNPIPWNTDKYHKNEYTSRYNQKIKELCDKKRISFADIFAVLSKIDYCKLLEDGVHPNSKGHQKIFELVENYLIKNKII
jgi:lysophospholipase L1-like esterase